MDKLLTALEGFWISVDSGKSLFFLILLFRVTYVCVPTLIRCPFHPRVTAVARKRPWSFCRKYIWQVARKHAYTLDPKKSERADYAAVQA